MVNRRLLWLAGIAVFWGAAILFRLISFQVFRHEEFAAKARRRQQVVEPIPAPRGPIFDRTGRPLALSVPGKSVYINPLKVNIAAASDLLSRVLGLDRAALYQRLQAAVAMHRGDLQVKRRISPEEADLLAKQPVDYIDLREEKQRHYPNLTLAAHALGSVDFEEKGSGGVEQALDKELRGIAGKERTFQDVKKRPIESLVFQEAKAGEALTLTIDERLQYLAERELAAAVQAHNALSGSVVAMNPKTGDLLVMASYPVYDPNEPPTTAEERAARMNHASSVPFEPGSVFKVITLSAALETTDLKPESLIDCHGGVLHLPGRTISDSHRGLGTIPMSEVLAHSSNVGAVEIGRRVGQENLNAYVRRFGIGQRTGIELPAESPGRLRPLSQWGKTSWASISFGHEVSTTTLQLAQAGSVIANGGLLVRPRLVLKRGDQPVAPQQPVRVLKPETAITMREMMAGVVEHGTGKKAQVAGYSVGGKTGSATIYDFATKHYTHTYNGTFMGFAPVTNPAIVVVVTLNGTHGNAGFGGEAAAPVFRALTAEALRVLDIPEDRPNEPPAKLLLAKAMPVDAPPEDSGDGQPNILEDATDEDGVAPATEPGPKVPNFRGMTEREVLAEAQANGLRIRPNGSGVARIQVPPAGAPLRQGELIRVVFGR